MQNDEDLKLVFREDVSFNGLNDNSEMFFELIIRKSRTKLAYSVLETYLNENSNPIDSEGFSPFHIACFIGNANYVEKFLNIGNYINCCISPNAQFFAGYSPLHLAVESKSGETVKLLLNHGADTTIKNAKGKSAFYLACEKKSTDPSSEVEIDTIKDLLMMSYYAKNPFSVEDEGFSLLHKNLFYKHMVHFNISYTVNFNTSWTTWTPLHFAIAQRKTKIIKILLDANANPNAKDDLGITPLHLACQHSFKEFSVIFTSNSNLEVDKWIVNQNEQIKITKMLLENNGNANAIDKFGKTPLFHALENFVKISPIKIHAQVKVDLINKRKELIYLLLQYNANVNVSDNEGITILHDLAEYDQIFNEDDKVEIAKVILKKGANINAKTKAEKTPLFLSIRNNYMDLAKELIVHNADVNGSCNIYNKFTPLQTLTCYSVYNVKSVLLLKLLLEHGADVHAKEVAEATALHIAIDCHGIQRNIPDEEDEMALALLKYGAEVDVRDKNGQTPLHRACLNRYTKGTIVLLNHGADINLVDEFDNSPLSYACYRVQEERDATFFFKIKHHMNKLKYLGFPVSEKNELCFRELRRFYAHRFLVPKNDQFLHCCANEVEKLKKTKLDNYTTLYNILFKNANEMVVHIKNYKFIEIMKSEKFEKEFRIYGYLLTLKLEKGLKREKLINPAEEAMKVITKYDLPHLCIKSIFKHLSDYDLKQLVEAQEVCI